jgi:hypothetical protein
MILTKPGKLCSAQDVANTTEDSDNVIKLNKTTNAGGTTLAVNGLEGAKLVIQNAKVAITAGTLTIDVVLAREATLDNTVLLHRIYIDAITDYRTVRAGALIHQWKIPPEIAELAYQISVNNSNSDIFFGLIITTATSTYYINAAVAPCDASDGFTSRQVTESPVGVPSNCSAGS